MNVPLHLVHLASHPFTTLPLAGFVITSTPLLVVVIVTESVRFWKDCVASELKQHRHLRMVVGAVFLIGFFVSLTHAFAPLVVLLSAFFPRVHFVLLKKQCKAQLPVSLPRRALAKASHSTCGILSWNCCFMGRFAVSWYSLLMKSFSTKLHSLVIFLWIYSPTRKVLTVLRDASSGTIVHTCKFGALDFSSLELSQPGSGIFQEIQTALLVGLALLIVDTKKRGMHCGFTGEETLITQSFQCHLVPQPCVLGEGI